jgi:predicted nucleic acid-binding Zn ribbon protein
MDDKEKQREMKRFKILMFVVAAFAALFPVYQCARTLMRF